MGENTHTRTFLSKALAVLAIMLKPTSAASARSNSATGSPGINHITEIYNNCSLSKELERGKDGASYNDKGRALHATMGSGKPQVFLHYNADALAFQCDGWAENCGFRPIEDPQSSHGFLKCKMENFEMDLDPNFKQVSFPFFLIFFQTDIQNVGMRTFIPIKIISGKIENSDIGCETTTVKVNSIETVYSKIVDYIQASYANAFGPYGNVINEELYAELLNYLSILQDIIDIRTEIKDSKITGKGVIYNAYFEGKNDIEGQILVYNSKILEGATLNINGETALGLDNHNPPNYPQNSPPRDAIEYVKQYGAVIYKITFQDIPPEAKAAIKEALEKYKEYGIQLVDGEIYNPYGEAVINSKNLGAPETSGFTYAQVDKIGLLPTRFEMTFNNMIYNLHIASATHEGQHAIAAGRHDDNIGNKDSVFNCLSQYQLYIHNSDIMKQVRTATTNLGEEDRKFLEDLRKKLGAEPVIQEHKARLYFERATFIGKNDAAFLANAPALTGIKLKKINPGDTILCKPSKGCGPIDEDVGLYRLFYPKLNIGYIYLIVDPKLEKFDIILEDNDKNVIIYTATIRVKQKTTPLIETTPGPAPAPPPGISPGPAPAPETTPGPAPAPPPETTPNGPGGQDEPEITVKPPETTPGQDKTGIIIGGVIGLVVVLCSTVLVILYYNKQKRNQRQEAAGEGTEMTGTGVAATQPGAGGQEIEMANIEGAPTQPGAPQIKPLQAPATLGAPETGSSGTDTEAGEIQPAAGGGEIRIAVQTEKAKAKREAATEAGEAAIEMSSAPTQTMLWIQRTSSKPATLGIG